tara:strand:- start:3 stop:182 length:180 start_codon:yes stop_codon:yes gene_type:complete
MTQYTNAQYCKDHTGNKISSIKIKLEGSNLHIPIDPDNTDYQEVMEQVKEGTLTIQDAE